MNLNARVPFWALFLVLLFSLSHVHAQESFEEQLKIYDRDDIHSIHKRLYSKVGRHEVSLNAGAIMNNNGFALLTGTYQYHFFESLSFEAALGGYAFQTNDDNKIGFYQASVVFSPIYGKISWFTWAVLNFDLYFVGGAGVASYSGLADGTSIMGSVGFGSKVFITEYLAAKLEFRDYIYDRKLQNDSEISHNYAITAGLSVFVPFKQDL